LSERVNGVGVYRTFLEYALGLPRKVWNMKIVYGRQPDFISDCVLFAMPSSSPRAAAYPTAKDKLPFYVAIKEMLDEIRWNERMDSINVINFG